MNGIGSQIAAEAEYVSQCDNCSGIPVLGLMNVVAIPGKDPPWPLDWLPCRGSRASLVGLCYTSDIVSWSLQGPAMPRRAPPLTWTLAQSGDRTESSDYTTIGQRPESIPECPQV